MIKEIWMPVLGYEEQYVVSNFGKVKSLSYRHTGKEKILSTIKATNGYLQVHLSKNGKQKMFLVALLVWNAFNGLIPEGMQINHINEDKTDNRLENLNLMTPKENCNWGTRNKRIGKATAKNNPGAKNKIVNQYTLEGEHVMTWFSASDIQRELGHLGFNQAAISRCCNGKRKTHKNYIWKYDENNQKTTNDYA